MNYFYFCTELRLYTTMRSMKQSFQQLSTKNILLFDNLIFYLTYFKHFFLIENINRIFLINNNLWFLIIKTFRY